MKQIENNFAVSGFVGKDAEIRQFANASVARFSLAVSRQEKNGEETKRVSAFINVEALRNNANTDSLAQITKGTLLTVEGYFKPEEWIDKDGVKHNRIVMVANKFYQTPDKVALSGADTKKKEQIAHYLSVCYPLTHIKINSPYGYRKDPFTGKRKFHNGIDLHARRAKVFAMMQGRVLKVGQDKVSGKYVTL